MSEVKIKAGVYVGHQVKLLINSDSFFEKLSEVEQVAYTSFLLLVKGFLGKHKVENCRKIIDKLVAHTEVWAVGCC